MTKIKNDLSQQGPSRRLIIRISTLAAEAHGGGECCKNKCHHIKEAEQCKEVKIKEHILQRCCSMCNPNYLGLDQRALVKNLFNIEPGIGGVGRGFLGPEGCRLPRAYRPSMCLLYTCRSMEQYAPKAAKILQDLSPYSGQKPPFKSFNIYEEWPVKKK